MSRPLHPEDIKARIRIKYDTLLKFERQHGLPPNSTVDVLRGRTVGNETVSAIASALGVSVKSIAQPKKAPVGRRKPQHTSINMDSHRLNAGAK